MKVSLSLTMIGNKYVSLAANIWPIEHAQLFHFLKINM